MPNDAPTTTPPAPAVPILGLRPKDAARPASPVDLADPRLRRAALVSLRTAARLLDSSVRTVRRMIERGELPAVHLSARAVRVPLMALERITQSATLTGAEGGKP